MRILQLVSCRGWSSDAYWAARISRELERRGHEVTLGCRRGTDAAVIDRARGEGVARIETFEFAGGVRLAADGADVRRLARALLACDVVHVHRGKEHWLAVAASRLGGRTRPIVRTRHIAQAVRPHAANRWLYRRATALVVTVSDAIRQQYLAAGLLPPERVIALPGGADADAYRPRPADSAIRAALGGTDVPLIGLVSGFRVMKGHQIVVEAAKRLIAAGRRVRFAFVGRGARETVIRDAIKRAGLEQHDAVGQMRQLVQTRGERRIARPRQRAISDGAPTRGRPDVGAEARADHLHGVLLCEQPREQVGAARRVVRQVEGENRDLHAARRAYWASSASATFAPE
jgi:glycosyltransferase involved in cell wall biosynthesis